MTHGADAVTSACMALVACATLAASRSLQSAQARADETPGGMPASGGADGGGGAGAGSAIVHELPVLDVRARADCRGQAKRSRGLRRSGTLDLSLR